MDMIAATGKRTNSTNNRSSTLPSMSETITGKYKGQTKQAAYIKSP